jgi:integration host factor subunit beta
MRFVTRAELVNWISRQSRYLDQSLVDGALRDLLEYIADCLRQGHRIEIRGFGTFTLRYRRPRMARNPKTGAILYTKEKYIPHFKPGKALREQVNKAYLLQVKRKQGWVSKNKEKYQDSDASG